MLRWEDKRLRIFTAQHGSHLLFAGCHRLQNPSLSPLNSPGNRCLHNRAFRRNTELPNLVYVPWRWGNLPFTSSEACRWTPQICWLGAARQFTLWPTLWSCSLELSAAKNILPPTGLNVHILQFMPQLDILKKAIIKSLWKLCSFLES